MPQKKAKKQTGNYIKQANCRQAGQGRKSGKLNYGGNLKAVRQIKLGRDTDRQIKIGTQIK